MKCMTDLGSYSILLTTRLGRMEMAGRYDDTAWLESGQSI